MDTKIELSEWGRREIYEFFSGASNPYYMVTFRQDVTKLRDYAKRNGLSFYYAMVWICTEAINRVEAFHYVIRGGDIYRIDHRDPSFTDLRRGEENFYIVTLPMEKTMAEFDRAAKARSAAQKKFIDQSGETDRLLYFSCLPWLDVTAITNERDLRAPGAQDESVPHIAWGKYAARDGRWELGISIEVNHRLLDGVHLGQFGQELTRLIDELDESDK